MRSSSIVLLSGGLDSLAAFHWAKEESDLMLGLTFDYGQRAAKREIESAAAICRHYDVKHRVIEVPWYRDLNASALLDSHQALPELSKNDLDDAVATAKSAKAVWVPNRNGVFINIAAALAESMVANWVVVGFNKEEGKTFPDNSEEFLKGANESLKFSTNQAVNLKAPMVSKTKKEIVQWGIKQKIDFSNLWSCYRGGEKMCGTCESCLRCRRALEEGGGGKWMKKLF